MQSDRVFVASVPRRVNARIGKKSVVHWSVGNGVVGVTVVGGGAIFWPLYGPKIDSDDVPNKGTDAMIDAMVVKPRRELTKDSKNPTITWRK